MKGIKHFKSKEAYRKWLSYGHMRTKKGLSVHAKKGRTSLFASTPSYQKVYIGGKAHKVRHRR